MTVYGLRFSNVMSDENETFDCFDEIYSTMEKAKERIAIQMEAGSSQEIEIIPIEVK